MQDNGHKSDGAVLLTLGHSGGAVPVSPEFPVRRRFQQKPPTTNAPKYFLNLADAEIFVKRAAENLNILVLRQKIKLLQIFMLQHSAFIILFFLPWIVNTILRPRGMAAMLAKANPLPSAQD